MIYNAIKIIDCNVLGHIFGFFICLSNQEQDIFYKIADVKRFNIVVFINVVMVVA